MIVFDKNLDNVGSQEFYNNLFNLNITIGAKPYSSIVEHTCSCGHERVQHSRKDYSFFDFNEKCNVKDCYCKRFCT